MRRVPWVFVAVGLVGACSSDEKRDTSRSQGGAQGGSSRGGNAGATNAGTSGNAGATNAGTSGSAAGGRANSQAGAGAEESGGAAESSGGASTGGSIGTTGGQHPNGGEGGDGGADSVERVPLPAGSREYQGIVNLVDAAAAAELEQSILDTSLHPNFLRLDAPKAVNLFLDHYSEDYDFLFLFTDHPVKDATFAGRFTAINHPAEPGGGQEIEIALGGYKSNGRLKGIIVVPFQPGVFPPLPHEVLHYWANYLDASFGFGIGRNVDYGPHWGFAGVNGQLGGFDPATLRCETPADAMPPNCTKLTSGRTRYVVAPFAPHANGFRDVPYSPLELYLMGLIPASEAPQQIPMLTGAEQIGTIASLTEPMHLEADALTSVRLSDIIARHGVKTQLPANQRLFSSAFAVISATPADESVLATVSEWAGAFGNHRTLSYGSSFEKYTGGRAKMETLLGARRPQAAPAPTVRERFACDILAQDCGRPELACYLWPPSICVLSGGVKLDQPCNATFACAPGLACVSGANAPDDYVCKPFCDPTQSTGTKACDVVCPDAYVTLKTNGTIAGAFCVPQ